MKVEYEQVSNTGYDITHIVLRHNHTTLELRIGTDGYPVVEGDTENVSLSLQRLSSALQNYRWGWSPEALEYEINMVETYDVAEAVQRQTKPDYHDGRIESLETQVRGLQTLLIGLISGVTLDPKDVDQMMNRKWRFQKD